MYAHAHAHEKETRYMMNYNWNATKYETRNVNVGRQGHENEPINEWGDDGLHACKWNVRGHLKFTFYCFPVKTQLLQNTTFYIRL